MAERHVEESRARIVRQRLQITELESSGRASSLTAQMARGLLKVMQKELTTHLAERDRLRHQLNLPRDPRTQGTPVIAGGGRYVRQGATKTAWPFGHRETTAAGLSFLPN